LQIEQNTGVLSMLQCDLPDGQDSRGVFLLRPVRSIEAENINSRLEQTREHSGDVGCGPQRRYDLGVGHINGLS
jgi:hypothetical protein